MNAKKLLINAIETLVLEKPFSQITVQNILDEAEVSRGTFYKYYKDKYDLANSYYESHVSTTILSKYDGHNWHELQYEISAYIKMNKAYFLELISVYGVNSFISFLQKYTFDFYSDVFLHNMKQTNLTSEQYYQLWFISNGLISVFEKWLSNGCVESPQKITDLSLEMIPEIYYNYI